MPHADPLQLIELANGALPDDQADALRSHLAGCPACRQALARIQQVNQALDAAAPEPPPSLDLTDAVLAAIDADQPTVIGRVSPLLWQSAAAMVVAGLLGWAAGTLTQPDRATPPVEWDHVADDLNLSALQVDSPAGLAEWLFLDDTADPAETGGAG